MTNISKSGRKIGKYLSWRLFAKRESKNLRLHRKDRNGHFNYPEDYDSNTGRFGVIYTRPWHVPFATTSIREAFKGEGKTHISRRKSFKK